LYLRRTFPLCSLFSLQSFREAEQRRLQIYWVDQWFLFYSLKVTFIIIGLLST
jgi:hypothetical protein